MFSGVSEAIGGMGSARSKLGLCSIPPGVPPKDTSVSGGYSVTPPRCGDLDAS